MGSLISTRRSSTSENPETTDEPISGPPFLPAELLLRIGDQLLARNLRETFRNLLACSHATRALLEPVLYRSLDITRLMNRSEARSAAVWRDSLRGTGGGGGGGAGAGASNITDSRFEKLRTLRILIQDGELLRIALEKCCLSQATLLRRLEIILPEAGHPANEVLRKVISKLPALEHLSLDLGNNSNAAASTLYRWPAVLRGSFLPPTIKTLHIEGRKVLASWPEPHTPLSLIEATPQLDSWSLSTMSCPDFTRFPDAVSKLARISTKSLSLLDPGFTSLLAMPEFNPTTVRLDVYYLDGRSKGTWNAICKLDSIEQLELVAARTDALLEITRFPRNLRKIRLERPYLSLRSWYFDHMRKVLAKLEKGRDEGERRVPSVVIEISSPQDWNEAEDTRKEELFWKSVDNVVWI